MNMQAKKITSAIISAVLIYQPLFMIPSVYANTNGLSAADYNRGLAVMNTGGGIYLSWRLFENEDKLFGNSNENTVFNIYKDGKFLASVDDTTNYTDKEGSMSSDYAVAAVVNGEEGKKCAPQKAYKSGENYFDIPLDRPKAFFDGTDYYERKPNDTAVADLDGDGEYELVVKWIAKPADNSSPGITGNVLLDAYKLDGTKLWRIDLGRNIREGSHYTQFIVYDLDNDGKAEMACKTAAGSVDGKGSYVSLASLDQSIRSIDNSANYVDENGFITEGEELYTVFDGETGAALDTIYYPFDRYPKNGWGKSTDTTNRLDRFVSCVAYLDGVTPSVISLRGYYGRMTLAAMNLINKRIDVVKTFDTNTYGMQYEGQGNHNMTVADVDGDGKDEILTGGICWDDDLSVLWCSYRGHGDALHIGDYDPIHDGLEYFCVQEEGGELNYRGIMNDYGMTVYAAESGEELLHINAPGDTGRGMMANVGAGGYYQAWSSDTDTYMSLGGNNFEKIDIPSSSCTFRIFWDGDLYDELLDGCNIAAWTGERMYRIFDASKKGCEKINGTKSNPALQADILGDWREEVIYPTQSYNALRVFVSDIPTDYKIKTLMHDHMYRMGVATENSGYNQPPHVGFFLNDEIFNGKTEIKDENVSFHVTDESGKAIRYAYITINGNTLITDEYGNADTVLKTREYSYIAEADGYKSEIGAINAADGTYEVISLTRDITETHSILPHSSEITMYPETVERLLYTADGNDDVTILSANNSIVEILQNKYMYAKSAGSTDVTISAGDASRSVKVNVISKPENPQPERIEILGGCDTIYKSSSGEVKSPYFEAIVYDGSGARIHNAEIIWSSSGAELSDTNGVFTKIYVPSSFSGDTVSITAVSGQKSVSKNISTEDFSPGNVLFESNFNEALYRGISVVQQGTDDDPPEAQTWTNNHITFNGGFRSGGVGDHKTGISTLSVNGNRYLSCIAGNRNTGGRNAFITLDCTTSADADSSCLVFETDLTFPSSSKQDMTVLISGNDNPVTMFTAEAKGMKKDVTYHYVLVYNGAGGYTEFITDTETNTTVSNKLTTKGRGIARIDFTGPGGSSDQWAEVYVDNMKIYETSSAFSEVTFKVRDNNGAPIQDAVIDVGGITVSTDAVGSASLALLSGTYNAQITYGGDTVERLITADGSEAKCTVYIDAAPFCTTILTTDDTRYIAYNAGSDKTVSVTKAAYNNGRLLEDLEISTMTLPEGYGILPLSCSRNGKIFIWNSLLKMRPVL